MDALNFFGTSLHFGQTPDVIIWVAVISAASAIASAALVGYVSYQSGRKLEHQRFVNNDRLDKQKIENANRLEKQKNENERQLERQRIENTAIQRKQQAYSQLMGRKSMTLQSYASYYSEFIRSEYLDYRSRIVPVSHIDYKKIRKMKPEEATIEFNRLINLEREDLPEFKSSMEADQRSRDLQLQLGRSSERLWITIGLIRILFSNTQDLRDLIKLIEKTQKDFEEFEREILSSIRSMKDNVEREAGFILTNSQRDLWFNQNRDQAISWLESHSGALLTKVNDLERHIANLLNYLEAELDEINEDGSIPTTYIEIDEMPPWISAQNLETPFSEPK